MNSLISELEAEIKSNDTDRIRSKMQAIEGALNGIVSQHQAAGASHAQQSEPDNSSGAASGRDSDSDVVDADFEEA
jgi:hypothetical protein